MSSKELEQIFIQQRILRQNPIYTSADLTLKKDAKDRMANEQKWLK